jgi:hypothetical protein
LSADGSDLREALAQFETELATLRAELTAFEAEYLRRVGVVAVQVQEIEARILALVAARSGAADDRAAAAAADARFRETTTALRSIPAPAGRPLSDNIKTLFRDAAKRMHPDIVQDAAGRVHAEAFMKRLNHAYRRGDSVEIAGLMRQWESSPYASGLPAGGSAAVRALQVAVADAQRRLEEARESQLAQLMEQALAAELAGRDLLAELRADAEAALTRARATLANMDD